ncbi:MAG: hypothetical protein AB7R55_09045 [Gemmatimonadales bacterium]
MKPSPPLLVLLLLAPSLDAQSPAEPRPAPDAGEPATTPGHGIAIRTGAWSLGVHGSATFGTSRQGGPRGERSEVLTSMASLVASRPLGGGLLALRAMTSIDPVLGADGYPLLLQTGESVDGLTPLRDRQHPHDFVAELGASYRHRLDPELDGFVYLAAVGAPALGPVPYFHRASGAIIPEAPIGHHLHDATHISHGVLTVGVVSQGKVTIEGSLFNGREPDGDRWDIDEIRFDSYAVRATVALGPRWAVQASGGVLSQPERLHPTINQVRLSGSITHSHPLAGGHWQTTLAVGRGLSQRREILLSEAQRIFPPTVLAHYTSLVGETGLPADSLYLVFPSKTRTGLLLESTLTLGRTSLATRLERVAKDELFDPTDLRHSRIFSVSKASVALLQRLPIAGSLAFGVGGLVGVHLLPSEIRADYGGTPLSYQLFTRLELWGAGGHH